MPVFISPEEVFISPEEVFIAPEEFDVKPYHENPCGSCRLTIGSKSFRRKCPKPVYHW